MGGSEYTDVMNMLLLLLPGTPTCYYGDELGMTDVFIPYNETKDPAGKKWGPHLYLNFTRDPERTPMQWNGGFNAGFSNSTNGTWLPVGSDHTTVNVDVENTDTTSHLNIFKQLLSLRLQPTFQSHGENLITVDAGTEDLFLFARNSTITSNYVIAINIGHANITSSFQISSLFNFPSASSAQVVLTSSTTLAYSVNQTVGLSDTVRLRDSQGLVFKII